MDKLTDAQHEYLERGLAQPGGKLPLFDGDGQRVDPRTVRACIDKGWPNRGSSIRSSLIGWSVS